MSVWKTIEYPVKSHWVSGIGHKEDEPKKSCQFIAFLLKCHDPFEEPFNRICIHLLSVFDFFFVIRNSNAKLGEQTNPSTIKPIYSQYIIMAIKYMLLRKCVWGFSSLPVAIYSPMQAQLARIIFRLFYLCRIAYDSNLPPVNHLVLCFLVLGTARKCSVLMLLSTEQHQFMFDYDFFKYRPFCLEWFQYLSCSSSFYTRLHTQRKW